MNRSLRIVCAAMASVGTALGAGGCLAVAAGAVVGAGAYAYHAGKLNARLDASLDRSFEATRTALTDMGFTELSTAKDALTAHATAETADAKEVTVHLEKVADDATDISIRIGAFGDERKSTEVLAKIRERL